jgi:hypothetical protein
MKRQQLIALLCGAFVTATAFTSAHAQKLPPIVYGNALEISIGGIGPGVDAKAFAKVRLLLAEALYSQTIGYFDVYGYGKEGGFSACVEKGQFAAEGSFERLTKALNAIRVDRTTSFYNVDTVEHCTYPVPPEPVVTP